MARQDHHASLYGNFVAWGQAGPDLARLWRKEGATQATEARICANHGARSRKVAQCRDEPEHP